VDSVIFDDSLDSGKRFDIFSWPPIETTGYVDVNTLGLLFLGSVVLLSKGSRLSDDKLAFFKASILVTKPALESKLLEFKIFSSFTQPFSINFK